VKKFSSMVLPALTVLTIVFSIVWIILKSPPSFQPFLAGGLGYLISRFYENLKENKSRLYEKKREVYGRLLHAWKQLLINHINSKDKEQTITNEMLVETTDAAFDAVFYASDDVIKKYSIVRNYSRMLPPNGTIIYHLGKLLKSIRKDLGHTYTSLDEADILSMFINFETKEYIEMKILSSKDKS